MLPPENGGNLSGLRRNAKYQELAQAPLRDSRIPIYESGRAREGCPANGPPKKLPDPFTRDHQLALSEESTQSFEREKLARARSPDCQLRQPVHCCS